jgi:hypothetical protein
MRDRFAIMHALYAAKKQCPDKKVESENLS